jgi:hypothetical protein
VFERARIILKNEHVYRHASAWEEGDGLREARDALEEQSRLASLRPDARVRGRAWARDPVERKRPHLDKAQTPPSRQNVRADAALKATWTDFDLEEGVSGAP